MVALLALLSAEVVPLALVPAPLPAGMVAAFAVVLPPLKSDSPDVVMFNDNDGCGYIDVRLSISIGGGGGLLFWAATIWGDAERVERVGDGCCGCCCCCCGGCATDVDDEVGHGGGATTTTGALVGKGGTLFTPATATTGCVKGLLRNDPLR